MTATGMKLSGKSIRLLPVASNDLNGTTTNEQHLNGLTQKTDSVTQLALAALLLFVV